MYEEFIPFSDSGTASDFAGSDSGTAMRYDEAGGARKSKRNKCIDIFNLNKFSIKCKDLNFMLILIMKSILI